MPLGQFLGKSEAGGGAVESAVRESQCWGLGALCLLCGWLCLYRSLYLASESSAWLTRASSPHNSAPDYSLFQEKGLVVPDSPFPPHQGKPWGWGWLWVPPPPWGREGDGREGFGGGIRKEKEKSLVCLLICVRQPRGHVP